MSVCDYLIELGCEELPAQPLYRAASQFRDLIGHGLDEAGLDHGELRALFTPRRIAVIVADVAARTEELTQCLRGPAASIAFDVDGTPTKAAEGFARGRGATAADLIVRDEKGKDYVFLEMRTPSREAAEILAETVLAGIAGISWPRSQRWGRGSARFGRPIRWMVSLLGDAVVPLAYAGVHAGRVTRGLRVLDVEPEVAHADAYERTLEDAGVIVDPVRRRALIEDGIARIERERGVVAERPRRIFDEVVNLVECPRVLVGSFDEEFLRVPQEIICDSMLSHQRYFPLRDASGALTRDFILVANTPLEVERDVIAGNERVVRARLFDAKFFYEEDLSVPLEDLRARLARVGFQKQLGSVLQKSERIEALAGRIAAACGFDRTATEDTARAARFAKADLVSSAVIEFTSQQGVMGGYYARAAGERPQVAAAIRDHYRPRFAGDELPESSVGGAVAAADKLDTIAGIFAIDEPPTGSSDPYAVRRAAIGIIAIARKLVSLDLGPLIDDALGLYAGQGIDFDRARVAAAIRTFILGRLAAQAREEGIAADTVSAVASVGVLSPAVFFARARALDDAREHDHETFDDLATAFFRASHLTEPALGVAVDETLLGPSERALLDVLESSRTLLDTALADGDYTAVFSILAALRAPIDRFFEEVLVMDEDRALRENRLRLLNRLEALFAGIVDIGELGRRR